MKPATRLNGKLYALPKVKLMLKSAKKFISLENIDIRGESCSINPAYWGLL